MSSLANQVIMITGSSRGLGRALAAEFQRAGAAVVVSSRKGDSILETVAALPDPARALGLPCDVRDLDQVHVLADAAVQRFGRLDIWINNAGLAAPWGKLLDIDAAAWRASFDTNVVGTYNGCRAALEKMLPVGRGRILNVLGFGWDRPAPNQSPYGTSKAAAAQLTRTLAREYGGGGISINAVLPGMMWTDLLLRAEGVDDPTLRMRMEWAMRVFGNPPEVPARFIVRALEREQANGKFYRVVGPGLIIPRMLRELIGAGKRNPRPWEESRS